MISAQTVKARAIEGALGKTGSGNEQIAIAFQILEGIDEGQTITWYGFFTDKTIARTLDTLTTCGWEGDDLFDMTGIDKNEVTLVIEHEEGQDGNPRPRVRWVNRAGGVAMQNRLNAAEAQSFSARMKGTVLAHRKSKGAPKPAQAKTNTNARSKMREDDDIPF